MAYVNKDGKPEVIPTRDGTYSRTMASVVAFTKSGRIVGRRAKEDVRSSTLPVTCNDRL